MVFILFADNADRKFINRDLTKLVGFRKAKDSSQKMGCLQLHYIFTISSFRDLSSSMLSTMPGSMVSLGSVVEM